MERFDHFIPWVAGLAAVISGLWKLRKATQEAHGVRQWVWDQWHKQERIWDLEDQLQAAKRNEQASNVTAEQALSMLAKFTQAANELQEAKKSGVLIVQPSSPEPALLSDSSKTFLPKLEPGTPSNSPPDAGPLPLPNKVHHDGIS